METTRLKQIIKEEMAKSPLYRGHVGKVDSFFVLLASPINSAFQRIKREIILEFRKYGKV